MRAKVQKWGNSFAIRIPKTFASEMQLDNNSIVEISKVKDKIVIKSIIKPRWTLDDLLAGITDNNIHHEVDTGFAVGNEIW